MCSLSKLLWHWIGGCGFKICKNWAYIAIKLSVDTLRWQPSRDSIGRHTVTKSLILRVIIIGVLKNGLQISNQLIIIYLSLFFQLVVRFGKTHCLSSPNIFSLSPGENLARVRYLLSTSSFPLRTLEKIYQTILGLMNSINWTPLHICSLEIFNIPGETEAFVVKFLMHASVFPVVIEVRSSTI